MDMGKAHGAVAKVIGDAVIQVIAEGGVVTKESIADAVIRLSDGEPDLAVEFALGLLRR